MRGAAHLSTEEVCERLHAVADPEHRHAEFQKFRIELWGISSVDARRAAGENDAFDVFLTDRGDGDTGRDYFTENFIFAHAARDELIVLLAEIDYEECFHKINPSLRGVRWTTKQSPWIWEIATPLRGSQ